MKKPSTDKPATDPRSNLDARTQPRLGEQENQQRREEGKEKIHEQTGQEVPEAGMTHGTHGKNEGRPPVVTDHANERPKSVEGQGPITPDIVRQVEAKIQQERSGTPPMERKDVLTDGGIGKMAARYGIDLVTPEQWPTKGYPMMPGFKDKEEWSKLPPGDQRLHWITRMMGGSMSGPGFEEDDLRDYILNGGKFPSKSVGVEQHEAFMTAARAKPKGVNVEIPKHIHERPGFKDKLDRLLKEENSEGLKFPHTFIAGGSIELVGDTLLERRQSIAENFAGDPLADVITGAYTLALSQLKLQMPEPTHRLECLLTVNANNVLIDWRTKHTNLPRGFSTVAEFERYQQAQAVADGSVRA